MILIGLGSNLSGPHHETSIHVLRDAQAVLARAGVVPFRTSRVWETEPVPKSDQPLYYNQVVAVNSSRDPHVILHVLHRIEEVFGRVRTGVRNEPRILDLDLLVYRDLLLDEPGITLPHPRLHERGFVLYPLRDVAPGFVHPVTNKSINHMIRELPPSSGACRVVSACVDWAAPRPGLF
jgi:2-amino-4-hydroxy-6-hydroxymethyldihydropteridine diphosphokinase